MLVTWLKKTDFNAKVTEIEGKIPSISGFLPTNTFNSKVSDNQNCSVKARYKQFGQ